MGSSLEQEREELLRGEVLEDGVQHLVWEMRDSDCVGVEELSEAKRSWIVARHYDCDVPARCMN